ncbi:MAG: ribosome silencing factor [Planctomycetes bacterium]|nr:ribosome silencing factor [Planctomycetota bacterium]
MTTIVTARQLALTCAKICDDKKAENVTVLDVRKLTFITDYFILCSTQNERQSHAIAEEISVKLKSKGLRPVGNSHAAQRDGVWVLQDFGDVVVHILREDQRAFYDLDSLWADAPRVTWKRATKKRSETKKADAE